MHIALGIFRNLQSTKLIIWTLVDESNISLPSYFLSICVENRCRDTRVKSWVGYPAFLAKYILVRREPINTKGIHKERDKVVTYQYCY